MDPSKINLSSIMGNETLEKYFKNRISLNYETNFSIQALTSLCLSSKEHQTHPKNLEYLFRQITVAIDLNSSESAPIPTLFTDRFEYTEQNDEDLSLDALNFKQIQREQLLKVMGLIVKIYPSTKSSKFKTQMVSFFDNHLNKDNAQELLAIATKASNIEFQMKCLKLDVPSSIEASAFRLERIEWFETLCDENVYDSNPHHFLSILTEITTQINLCWYSNNVSSNDSYQDVEEEIKRLLTKIVTINPSDSLIASNLSSMLKENLNAKNILSILLAAVDCNSVKYQRICLNYLGVPQDLIDSAFQENVKPEFPQLQRFKLHIKVYNLLCGSKYNFLQNDPQAMGKLLLKIESFLPDSKLLSYKHDDTLPMFAEIRTWMEFIAMAYSSVKDEHLKTHLKEIFEKYLTSNNVGRLKEMSRNFSSFDLTEICLIYEGIFLNKFDYTDTAKLVDCFEDACFEYNYLIKYPYDMCELLFKIKENFLLNLSLDNKFDKEMDVVFKILINIYDTSLDTSLKSMINYFFWVMSPSIKLFPSAYEKMISETSVFEIFSYIKEVEQHDPNGKTAVKLKQMLTSFNIYDLVPLVKSICTKKDDWHIRYPNVFSFLIQKTKILMTINGSEHYEDKKFIQLSTQFSKTLMEIHTSLKSDEFKAFTFEIFDQTAPLSNIDELMTTAKNLKSQDLIDKCLIAKFEKEIQNCQTPADRIKLLEVAFENKYEVTMCAQVIRLINLSTDSYNDLSKDDFKNLILILIKNYFHENREIKKVILDIYTTISNKESLKIISAISSIKNTYNNFISHALQILSIHFGPQSTVTNSFSCKYNDKLNIDINIIQPHGSCYQEFSKKITDLKAHFPDLKIALTFRVLSYLTSPHQELSFQENLDLLESFLQLNGKNITSFTLHGNLNVKGYIELLEKYCPNLLELGMELCKIDSHDIKNLPKLTALTSLKLSNNTIEEYPSLDNLINLQHLDLSRSGFKVLPNISNLRKLISLNLSQNPFKILPSLKKLIYLETLDLTYCDSLVSLPDFNKNISLQNLNLQGCFKNSFIELSIGSIKNDPKAFSLIRTLIEATPQYDSSVSTAQGDIDKFSNKVLRYLKTFSELLEYNLYAGILFLNSIDTRLNYDKEMQKLVLGNLRLRFKFLITNNAYSGLNGPDALELLFIINFILKNKEIFKDQKEIIEFASSVRQVDSLQRSPFRLYKKFRLDAESNTLSNYTPTKMNFDDKNIQFNLSGFNELSVSSRVITRSELPKSATLEAWVHLVQGLLDKVTKDSNGANRAFQKLGTNWAEVSIPLFNSQIFSNLMKNSSEEVSEEEAAWRAIFSTILDKDDKYNGFFTEQEEMLIKIAMGVQRCPTGQVSQILATYEMFVPPIYRYESLYVKPVEDESELDALKRLNEFIENQPNPNIKMIEKSLINGFEGREGPLGRSLGYLLLRPEYWINDDDDYQMGISKEGLQKLFRDYQRNFVGSFVGNCIKSKMKLQFSGSNKLMMELTGTDPKSPKGIFEPVHQGTYLQNRIGHIVGLPKRPRFDWHTNVICDKLLVKDETLLSAFFKHLTPMIMVDEIVKSVNALPDSEKRAFQFFLFGDEFWADKKQANINRKGAIELLSSLGYLNVTPQPISVTPNGERPSFGFASNGGAV